MQNQLSQLALQNSQRYNYVDITSDFFDITSRIQYGDIAKSHMFKLLQGTHALETLNPKLDTSLLEITSFDIESLKSIHQLNWVMNKLIGCLCSWLDNNALSVTILSCAYIEKILLNYRHHGTSNFSFNETFVDIFTLLKGQDQEGGEEKLLRDGIFRSFCLGLIQFVSFGLKLGMSGVVFEEEDLNTQTMDLNFLNEFPVQKTLDDLEMSIDWLDSQITQQHNDGGNDSQGFVTACLYLKLIKNLLSNIPPILTLRLELFTKNDNLQFNFIEETIGLIQNLQQNESYLSDLLELPNCFTANVQKKLNNGSPPKPLACMTFNDSLNHITRLLTDLKYMLNLVNTKNGLELVLYLRFLMNRRQFTNDEDEILGNHVIVRSLLQLFFVRDDESILGSTRWTITDMMMDISQHISLRNSKILSIEDSNICEELNQVLLDIKQGYYHSITLISQNPSRQRQFISKALILWDKLQVEAENLESKVNAQYTDSFSDPEIPVMPLASMVYYLKQINMLDYVFKSIELDLYRDLRELHVGYWLLSYILDYLLQHVQRLLDTKRLRINQLANFPKKIRKAKGDKKLKLRAEYEACRAHQDELNYMISYFEFEQKKLTLYKDLVELYLSAFQLLNNLGLLRLPKLCRVSEESLFNLQLKAFQSIGIPQIPGYQEYHENLVKTDDIFKVLIKEKNFKYFNVVVDSKSEEIKKSLNQLSPLISKFNFHPFLVESMKDELISLKKAHINIQLTIQKLLRSIETDKKDGVQVSIEKLENHLYFPALRITTTI